MRARVIRGYTLGPIGAAALQQSRDNGAAELATLAARARRSDHVVLRMGSEGFRALLFDLDGTLVDSERQTDAAIASVMRRRAAGADIDVALPPHETRGRTWEDIASVLALRLRGTTSVDAKVLAKELAEEWANAIDAMAPIEGAVEAAFAASRLFDVAVVSSSPGDLIDRVLLRLGIAACVRVRVGAEDVRDPKPNPECFLLAASRLDVPTSACIVFEDSRAGLEAARAARMPSVLVRTRCDELDACLALATASILHYGEMTSERWMSLRDAGPAALLERD